MKKRMVKVWLIPSFNSPIFLGLYFDFVKFTQYKNLYIRSVVFRDGGKMMIYNSPKWDLFFLNVLI